ncbi:MAG: hypothetical protein U1F68_10890 [Gammaproteobacteria bacterium]
MRELMLAVGVMAALIAGIIYFVKVLWPVLPSWLALIICIVMAVVAIGYPILVLGRWSDRLIDPKRRQPKPLKDDQDDSSSW